MNRLQKEEKMINEILFNFDFEECFSVMKFLNRKWFGEYEIPSVEKLKQSAEQKLKNCIEIAKRGQSYHYTYNICSGGLKATAHINRYHQIVNLQLEFVLTDWETDGDS